MAKDQGSRIVVCSKHNIPYDASKRGGCSRCIREWERQRKATASSEGIPTSVKLLGLLLAVAGLFFFLNRSENVEEEAPAVEARPTLNTSESATENALRQIIDDLPRLISAGRSETEVYMADASDPQRQKEDWEFWSPDWSGRVERLASKMPDRPDSQANLKLAVVFQEISRALDELASVVQTTNDGLPDANRVRKRFEQAEKAVQEARIRLSQLHR